MRFEVLILGANSALPAYGRHTTSQVLFHHEQQFLLDCGEGTQMRLLQYHIRSHRFERIFITHLHGDHVFGLPGLLTSFSLNNRETPLYIYGPHGLKAFLNNVLEQSYSFLSYPLEIIELDATEFGLIYETEYLQVFALPMKHRVPCLGYLFKEHPGQRRMRRDKIVEYSLSVDEILQIKAGGDLLRAGQCLAKHEDLVIFPPPPRSYAFCTDTSYNEELLSYLQGADLLYHEATFLDGLAAQAAKTGHSTAKQAAQAALNIKAKHLLIGHFSSRYGDLTPLLEEARSVFVDTSLAIEGKTFFV